MVFKLHFISGLPRAGSTLLSAILRQNPRFHADITSPVAMLCSAIQRKMANGGEFDVFFDDERRKRILKGTFSSYHANIPGGHVVFDTNRTWTGKAALLKNLYPDARIICCVRDVSWVIDSIERMLIKNPLQLSRIFNYQPGHSVYSRVETLMNSENGLIGQSWSTLRESWFGENADRLIVIQYDNLVREPERVINALYKELDEPVYAHDFDNVIYEKTNYDALLGMPGMHTVRKKVEYQRREICVPPDLFTKYNDANFWRKPELNHRGVSIL